MPDSPPRAQVAVVVVTHDAPDSLRRCLRSIVRHSQDVDHRLVVVDNGSRAPTRRFLARYAARRPVLVVRHGRNIGKAAALNDAVRRVRASWYAIVDDDAVVSSRWLTKLLAAAVSARPRPALVGCRSVLPNGRIHGTEMLLWIDSHGRGEPDLGQRSYTRFCDGLAGTCLLVRGDVFESVRFEESLGQQFEDVDFCLEARKRGFRALYCGDIVVRHEHLRRAANGQIDRNRAYMSRKWGVPVFPGSHPIDRLYAKVWNSQRDRDWAELARASMRLLEVDPVPTYPGWWAGMALSRLGRHAEALKILREALRNRCMSDFLRARIQLACERERALAVKMVDAPSARTRRAAVARAR